MHFEVNISKCFALGRIDHFVAEVVGLAELLGLIVAPVLEDSEEDVVEKGHAIAAVGDFHPH